MSRYPMRCMDRKSTTFDGSSDRNTLHEEHDKIKYYDACQKKKDQLEEKVVIDGHIL